MLLDTLHIRWSVNLQASLALLAEQLEVRGSAGAAARGMCQEIAASVANTTVTLAVPAVQLFCEACEQARRQGEDELAAKLERLVAALKQGEQRTVVATLGFRALSPRNIDGALEAVRRRVTNGP